MKKAMTILALTSCSLALTGLCTASGWPAQDKDLAAVMRVVQKAEASISPTPARQENEASVIKLLIKDEREGGEISLSFPLRLVEWLIDLDEDRTLDALAGDDEIKLKDILDKLKSLGATELLEIRDEDGLIRIWLE